MEAQVDVAEGEGSVGFVGDGKSSVCEFSIKVEAGDGVTFSNIMKEWEITEDEKTIPPLKSQEEIEREEKFEEELHGIETFEFVQEELEEGESFERKDKSDLLKKPEKPSKFLEAESESMQNSLECIDEDLEDFHIDEIEENWPENIRYSGDGVYADPMIVSFEIDGPVTLSVACVTTGGKLRLHQ